MGERVHRFNGSTRLDLLELIGQPTLLYYTNMYNTMVAPAKWLVFAHYIIIYLSFRQTETSGCCSQARLYDIFGRDLQDVSNLT